MWSDWICAHCILLIVFVHICVCQRISVCVCACNVGQAPWKQQQRSSAFKWIKTPAQSPGPAGIGQTGCSLDEDLRLIISHAAFVFAATVAYMDNTVQYMGICMLHILAGRQLASQPENQCCILPSVLNLLLSFSPAPLWTSAVTNFVVLPQWKDSSALNVYLQSVYV